MDKESKHKYEQYKLTVIRWEKEFKTTNKRIPSKVRNSLDIFCDF